jgi:transcriptional regulator of arginine metabolism
MDQSRRRKLIAQVLERGTVRSQEELAKHLRSHGVDATQGTLSRDLRALGVVKGPMGYALAGAEYAVPNSGLNGSELETAIREHMVTAEPAGNLVVVRTMAGHAQPVGLALDRRPPDGVVGTVAGDDTVFIAVRSPRSAARLAALFRRWAGSAAFAGAVK